MRTARHRTNPSQPTLFVVLLSVLALAHSEQASAQWGDSRLLSTASDWNNGNHSIKNPLLVASKNGGFHAAYIVIGGTRPALRYRRFENDVLKAPVTVINSARFLANADLTESGSGNPRLVWENWDVGPEVGWARSTNNGISFSAPTTISNSGQNAKWPQIAPLGLGASSEAVVSYWNASNKDLRGIEFNGTNWGSDHAVGLDGSNEYQVNGIARSPVDGSVYRLFGRETNGRYNISYTRYDGNQWSSRVDVATNLDYFPSRFSIAIGNTGKIMVVWDSENSASGRIYTPGKGWGTISQIYNKSFHGNVVAIPGTDNFYVFNPYAQSFVTARPIINDVGLPLEYIGTDLPDSFIPSVRGGAGPDGTLYATWEYWANDGAVLPQAYFAVREPVPVPEPATWILGTIGIAGLWTFGRRARRAKRAL